MKRAPTDDPGDAELAVGAPKMWAAGVPAVLHSAGQLVSHMKVGKAVRTMLRINQPDGFDCPGCAWPDPADPSHFEFCENGAKAIAEEATDRLIGTEFWAQHSVTALRERSDYWLGQQGRLTEPVIREPGSDRYRPIGWDEAFARIGAALRACPDPNRAVFYTSGRASNEAAFAYQLLIRQLGTNNLPDCSNMCHESSGVALNRTIGIGKGTVTLEDFDHAELIVVVGQNPGTNHPRMLSALERAKRKGATIVSVNPLREAALTRFRNPQEVRGVIGKGTGITDLYLPIRVGGDHALFQLVNRRLVVGGAVDTGFVAEHCAGYDELAAHLLAVDEAELLAATGLDDELVERFCEFVATNRRIIVCWAMGLTQHRRAVPTIEELSNTVLLRGAIGIRGAGLCPVRGHSNVQGDRTVGIYEKPSAAFLDALGAEFGFEPPRAHGYDTVEAIAAMAAGDVDVFVGLGGNFVSAAPDTGVTAAALERCGLTVQISTKLNRSHLHGGPTALILPCLGRTERDLPLPADVARGVAAEPRAVTVEDSMGIVHASRGRNRPASPQLRSEVDIVRGIAAATFAGAAEVDDGDVGSGIAVARRRYRSGGEAGLTEVGVACGAAASGAVGEPDVAEASGGQRVAAADGTGAAGRACGSVDWTTWGADYAEIRRAIEAVVPGFTDYEQRIEHPGGFALPNGPRDSRTFDTASGRAELRVNAVETIEVPEGRLLLQTLRSHDQFNTTIYGLDDRYRGVHGGRRVVFANAADLAARGIADGELVDIVSEWTDGERRAEAFRTVAYETPAGTCAAYFPEANVLVPLGSYAEGSQTPTSKSVIVRLERPPSSSPEG